MFEEAEKNFKAVACPHYSLSSYDALIKEAVETNYIKKSDVDLLKAWRLNPAEWNPNAELKM